MDKRSRWASIPDQIELRRQAVEEVATHPEWTLLQAFRHLKRRTRWTSAEIAALSGVSLKTVQALEQGRTQGTVQTMSRIFGIVGLKLAAVRPAATVEYMPDVERLPVQARSLEPPPEH